MKKKYKVLIVSSLVLLLGLVIGFSFFIQDYIKKEDLLVAIKESISKSFPGSKVDIKGIEILYGPSIKIQINSLKLTQKFPIKSYDFLEVQKINVNLPIFSILLGGGSIDVTLNDPVLNLEQIKNEKNWIKVFKDKSAIKDKSISDTEVVLPSFLVNSIANIRMINSNIRYDFDESKGSISFKKLVLKNVGLNSVAAFEIQSQYKRNDLNEEVSRQKDYSFNLTLIGSVDFAEYLKTSTLKIKSNFKLDEFFLNKNPLNLPMFKGDLSLALEKNGDLNGSVKSIASDNELSFNYTMTDGKLLLKDIDGYLVSKNLLHLIEFPEYINLSDSKLKLKGGLLFTRDSFVPDLNLGIDNLSIKVKDKNIPGKATLSSSKEGLKWAFVGNLFNGEVKSNGEVLLSWTSSETLEKRIKRYTHNLVLSKGNVIDKDFWEWIINSHNEIPDPQIYLPSGINTLTIEELKVGEDLWSGGGVLKTDGNKVLLTSFSFFSELGKIESNGEISFYKDSKNKKFVMNLIKLNVSKIVDSFETPSYIKGIVNGEILYTYSDKKNTKSLTRFDLTFGEGTLKIGNLFDEVAPFIKTSLGGARFLSIKDKDLQGFTSLSLKGSFSENNLGIKELNIKNGDDVFLFVKGDLDLKSNNATDVEVHYYDKKYYDNMLKKRTTLKNFPLYFKAKNFKFEPNELKTLKRLLRKTKLKKDKKKLNTKILMTKKKKEN